MLTNEQIISLGFVLDTANSTDDMIKYDFTVNRPDLHPLYTTNQYTLIYDVLNDLYDLAGNIIHNKMRVIYTTTYQGKINNLTELEKWMTQFLRKDLKYSRLLKK